MIFRSVRLTLEMIPKFVPTFRMRLAAEVSISVPLVPIWPMAVRLRMPAFKSAAVSGDPDSLMFAAEFRKSVSSQALTDATRISPEVVVVAVRFLEVPPATTEIKSIFPESLARVILPSAVVAEVTDSRPDRGPGTLLRSMGAFA